MPGYWILTATARPSCERRAVDLADRGGRERVLLDVVEQLVERFAEVLLLEHLPHLLPRHGGRAEVRSLASCSW